MWLMSSRLMIAPSSPGLPILVGRGVIGGEDDLLAPIPAASQSSNSAVDEQSPPKPSFFKSSKM